MDRLVFIFLVLILVSCDNIYYKEKGDILFQYTDNISFERAEQISTLIIDEIKLTDDKEIKEITEIRIDSGYFSIVLSIPTDKKVTGIKRGLLRQFAQNLSLNQLDNIPIHIIVTDSEFNPLGYLPYKYRCDWDRYEFLSGESLIKLSDNCDICWASNIDLLFRDKMPEIYNGQDYVLINIDVVHDTVKIDVIIDPKINLDTLTKQFNESNHNFFLSTFNLKTTSIQLINKETNTPMKVYSIKGLL